MKQKLNLLTRIGLMSLIFMVLITYAAPQANAQKVLLTVELSEWYSCPFVYSWDGAEYKMENDIYSVARNAAREYTDYLFMQNAIVPKDGLYSFEVREIPSEEAWTDMLKLIVIDHPANVSVGVDSSGNVHSYANPLPADSAYDGDGEDVLALISARDDNGVAMYHNEAVILDFSSVDISQGAKLVIDVDGFEGELLGNPTGQIPAIEVQTLELGSWVSRGSFFPKEYEASGVFDLQPYLGESKTVRLLSISCDPGKYHIVDYAVLDNTADDLSYSVVDASTAILNGSTDVLSEISGSDNVYAYTQGTDVIVVTFPFTPLSDEARSFVFVSEGYYKPLEGNTFYVDTWDGFSWVERATLYEGPESWSTLPDVTVTADLSAYLPDPCGEYKVKLRNSMNINNEWNEAYVDMVSLSVDCTDYIFNYAKESDITDILSQVEASDDNKWYAVNQWAVFKFIKPVILTVELIEWYSCPFVYSWDGAEYKMENDIYSVARNAGREYTDYLFMQNAIVPKDGLYSFEVREIPSEEAWTDMLKLIVIDHPANVSVGVDSSGNVHSYSNPLPADSAYDGDGEDVLALISSRDDSGVAMYHNEAVILDFSSVDISQGAKLVIDVDGFEGELSGNPTGQVPAIEVQTLELGSWVSRGSFFPKEFEAGGVFDLQPYLGESKSVRLLSISCDPGKYHIIDYAVLDNTADVLSYSVVDASTAVLNGSTDVLSEISGSDNVYAYTQGTDVIVVTFPFTPLSDEARSFVFVSEGYYMPLEGNTFYVDTWDGSSWVERATLYEGPYSEVSLPDTTVTADLSTYLPDPCGEYKVRLRNSMDTSNLWNEAYVDWVSLSVGCTDFILNYAKEWDVNDILSLVEASDDNKWDAVNEWAILKFSNVILTVELSEWYSCPFVYSWDGAEYKMENDIYSVARNAGREYTDYLFMQNAIVPKDGLYSFEVREIPSEEAWTDMLKLIVIDHPANVSVGVDSSGNVHSYANPLPADSAYDGDGEDVLALISSRDDSGVAMYHNEAVILDFSSVDISQGAKLVIDVDGFEGELSGNPTGQVPAIEVQTLELGSWVSRGSFFPKEYEAGGVFDLQPYLGESKTVRLLSISCDPGKYHIIDYAVLDNTTDVLSYSVVGASTAILNGSTDVLSEISGSDNVYAYTQGTDVIVVGFPASPLSDEARSFVFVSEGYYKPLEGNTYYVDTWDGSSWVERAILYDVYNEVPAPDVVVTADLSAYLPDPDGEYKIKIRNVLDPDWEPNAVIDWVSMSVGGVDYSLSYAKEFDITDILSLVEASDDIKWNATNKWAVFGFREPVLLTVELSEWYSCPFVFSWDGAEYKMENDIYSVARNAAREYTDYLFMQNAIVPKDGLYSFEVREIPSEEAWTDMLKLIVIDHPANVSVGVDSSGNVHSYSNPLPADSAYDGDGEDVLALISARDDNGVAMYHNEAVILDFSSVDISQGAKLVIDVDGFEGELLGNPTGQIPAIQIQTLELGSWVSRGSFLPKEFEAGGVFDLQPYLGESKTVRLLSISCDPGKYHIIDYAVLDNTADDLSYSVVDASSAVLNGSTDVLSEISGSDNVYAYTQGTDVIVVTFPFTPLSDEARSFVFVSEGYYKPLEGNTFYVDTWDGSSWVERATLYEGPYSEVSLPDVNVTADLSAYLPDPDGEYKVKLRNSMDTSNLWNEAWVDMVSMTVGEIDYDLTYAKEFDVNDILYLVEASDDIKWEAVNKWAIFKFERFIVQFEDFARFAKQWLREDCDSLNNWCEGADLNHKDGVNEADLELFVDKWLCPRPKNWPLK